MRKYLNSNSKKYFNGRYIWKMELNKSLNIFIPIYGNVTNYDYVQEIQYYIIEIMASQLISRMFLC
jgi:hypothetical protein